MTTEGAGELTIHVSDSLTNNADKGEVQWHQSDCYAAVITDTTTVSCLFLRVCLCICLSLSLSAVSVPFSDDSPSFAFPERHTHTGSDLAFPLSLSLSDVIRYKKGNSGKEEQGFNK